MGTAEPEESSVDLARPRVHIRYECTIGGSVEERELPFVVGVLSDLSGHGASSLRKFAFRKFVKIDRDSLDHVLQSFEPRLAIQVQNVVSPEGPGLEVELRFRSLDDFEPDRVAEQVESLRRLHGTRESLIGLRASLNTGLEELLQELVCDRDSLGRVSADLDASEIPQGGLAEKLLRALTAGRSAEWGRQPERGWLRDLITESRAGRIVPSRDAGSMLTARIAWIDREVSRQLRTILHHPEFRKLEAAWRGLAFLVGRTETSSTLEIRVLNVTRQELLRDFEKAAEFDQTALFQKVYTEAYEEFGGQPFSVLIGDYEIGGQPQDFFFLERISAVAAAAHAPFIAGASPGLFGWSTFGEARSVRDLARIFDRPDYLRWQAFRESEDSRYVGLTLPRILLRPLYETAQRGASSTSFDEAADGTGDEADYLWGNAAYAFAALLTDKFRRHGWCAPITGVSGGLVRGLPVPGLTADVPSGDNSGPLDATFDERLQRQLSDLGFLALVSWKRTDAVTFLEAPSCRERRRYDSDEANAMARLQGRLEYVLASSRFVHYLKSIVRDTDDATQTESEFEAFLNRWISGYVAPADASGEEAAARYPLAYARIEVISHSSMPRSCRVVVLLKPRFHLSDLPTPLRLVTTLPPPTRIELKFL